MKIHTTNYTNTFIVVAEDCPVSSGQTPPQKANAITAANAQFEMISQSPYKYTSDEVLFQVFADKNDLLPSQYQEAREQFFSKGQPCFRASPLTKRYGWGIHFDQNSKMAIYGSETKEYERYTQDNSIKIVKAMKSSK